MTNAKELLTGKLPDLMQLTDEQLNRVGNLIVLYEDKYNYLLGLQEEMSRNYNYLLGLQEEMSHIDMFGTKLYRNTEQVLADYVNLIVQLQNTLQSGFLDMSSIGDAVLSYILKGE